MKRLYSTHCLSCIGQRSISLLLLATATLSGCGASKSTSVKDTPHEVAKASLQAADESEQELFIQAQKHYAHALYTTARDRFQTLRTSYPDGPFAEYALLKIADSQFFSGAYTDAITAYDEYLKSHPGTSAAPYALFQQARASMLSIRGVGRDTGPIERAVTLFEQLKKDYPQSPYAELAVVFRNEALETLAQQDAFIGEFYEKRDHNTAARERDQQRRERLAAKTVAPRPNTTLGVPLQTKLTPPETVIARRANPSRRSATVASLSEEQLRGDSRDLRARASLGDTAALSAATFDSTADTPEETNTIFVRKIECGDDSSRQVYLHLSRPQTDSDYTAKIKRIPSDDRFTVNLQLPESRSSGLSERCFGRLHVAVGPDGRLSIAPASSVEAMTLASPPRLLLVVK